MAKNADTEKIRITRPCKVDSEHRAPGDVVTVPAQTAALLVAMNKAEPDGGGPKKGEKLTTKSAPALTRKG